jgi:ubiquinone/menaquinone biosynthesis C-methylase UbiE
LLHEYSNVFRRRRFNRFLSLVDSVAEPGKPARILDIGGRADYWDGLKPLWGHRSLDITVVNLEPAPEGASDYRHVHGDARNLSQFTDDSFQIVHSNSVLEHVGSWADKAAMAREIRRLAPHHFIQTPNFWFPIEPHFRTLFIHWYPRPWQSAMLMRRPRGYHSVTDYDDAMLRIEGIALLTQGEMARLFPDSRIEREWFGPLAKSLIAFR